MYCMYALSDQTFGLLFILHKYTTFYTFLFIDSDLYEDPHVCVGFFEWSRCAILLLVQVDHLYFKPSFRASFYGPILLTKSQTFLSISSH